MYTAPLWIHFNFILGVTVMTNHYQILNIEQNATEEEIKKAYRKLALKLHPDKGGDPEEFKKIRTAYDILLNAQTRRIHDQQLAGNLEAGARADVNLLNSSHQKFELAELRKAILAFSPKGIILEVAPTRPQWVEPPPQYSQALVPMDTNALSLGRQGKFEYTQDPSDPKSGKATLNLTQPIPVIELDLSSGANIQAGVQLAKAANWQGILISDTVPEQTRNKIEATCKEYGLQFGVIPTPRPSITISKPLEIEDKRTAPNPTPTPTPALR